MNTYWYVGLSSSTVVEETRDKCDNKVESSGRSGGGSGGSGRGGSKRKIRIIRENLIECRLESNHFIITI